jgi:hypothetical protein
LGHSACEKAIKLHRKYIDGDNRHTELFLGSI